MTVATIDTIVADMMFMTELNRLLTFQPLARVPRGSIQLNCGAQYRNNYKDGAIDRDFR